MEARGAECIRHQNSMKYLIITSYRYSGDYGRIRELETAAEVSTYLEENGTKDVVIAQRLGVKIDLCAWTAPVEEPAQVVPVPQPIEPSRASAFHVCFIDEPLVPALASA